MEVKSNGGDDFTKLQKKFKAAGAHGAAVRKALTKTIQQELSVIVDEQRHAATSMTVKGVKGKGSERRDQFYSGKRKRPRQMSHGLRATVARAIKSKVAYSGYKLGARITVDQKTLPQSQRKLPRYLNNPRGWRHPVWAHRDRWVTQVGEPYFDKPIERHRDSVRKKVKAAVDETMRTLK